RAAEAERDVHGRGESSVGEVADLAEGIGQRRDGLGSGHGAGVGRRGSVATRGLDQVEETAGAELALPGGPLAPGLLEVRPGSAEAVEADVLHVAARLDRGVLLVDLGAVDVVGRPERAQDLDAVLGPIAHGALLSRRDPTGTHSSHCRSPGALPRAM